MILEAWLRQNWVVLVSGREVEWPLGLPHPVGAGFRPIEFAIPNGQCANWVHALSDGSRVHVHEYADGRLIAHRDRFDPDRDVGALVAHMLGETFVGPMLLVFGVFIIACAPREA